MPKQVSAACRSGNYDQTGRHKGHKHTTLVCCFGLCDWLKLLNFCCLRRCRIILGLHRSPLQAWGLGGHVV